MSNHSDELHWWQSGVTYQIYPRSFKDTSADGIGDLQGVIEELDYLSDTLGVDAIWLSPFYPSPMADFGYDVSDYCDIHPMFGSLEVFDRLVEAAHRRGIKIIIDFVPNHTSSQHPWFLESRSSRENPKRDWYIWRDPKPGGSVPNNWGSVFGGPAWEWDERTGQFYFHHFLKEQPDLNWRNPAVLNAMLSVLRFWLERGVDGFRMDVVGMILKDPEFPDNPLNPDADPNLPDNAIFHRQQNIYNQDLDEVHELIVAFRTLLDEYGDRVAIGEVWSELPRWVKYYGVEGRGLHLPFNFRLINTPWTARAVRRSVDELEAAIPSFAWPNYVLGSHDVQRLATRTGVRQARNAALLLLTLRGTPTLYYGDELALENGIIPANRIQDPQGLSLGAHRTRDVARTPMQWDASEYAGFSSVEPWLPLSPDYPTRNVSAMLDDPGSILNLYRRLLALRRANPALTAGLYQPLDVADPGVFAFRRDHPSGSFMTVLNFSAEPCTVAVMEEGAGELALSTLLDRSGPVSLAALELRAGEGLLIRLQGRAS